MTFVVEEVSSRDYEQYGLQAIDEKYSATRSGDLSWAIDRGRGIYLRNTQSFKNWRPGIRGWNFLWRGELFEFESQLVGHSGVRNGPVWHHRKLYGFSIPVRFELLRSEIESDLREAFLAWRDNGILSTSTSFDLQLDITTEGAPQ